MIDVTTIQLLTQEEAAERTEEDEEPRHQIATEEQAERHVRLADQIEHEPAIHRRRVEDLLEALFEFVKTWVIVVGVPRQTAQLGIEEEVQGAMSMLQHPRYRMRIQWTIGVTTIAQDRAKCHRHIALEGHDRRLIAIGVGNSRCIDHDTIGLHADTRLRRRVAQ